MTRDETRKVVLASGSGIVLMGDFRRREAIRGKRSAPPEIQALALHPGTTVLHRIDFEWTYRGLEQKASLPFWKELSVGEATAVLASDILQALSNDVYDETDMEGFMVDDGPEGRRAVFHFVTPSGQVQLPLRYWQGVNPYTGQSHLACDLSRSESA